MPESSSLRVLLVTDVFPPGSGGSGWSTFYLGTALQACGHRVRVMRPMRETFRRPGWRVVEYGGLEVEEVLVPEFSGWASRLGLGKALWERVAARLLERRALSAALRWRAQVLHGQHAVSGIAAVRAAAKAGRKGVHIRSVVTVRDYWPLCPVSTRLFVDGSGRTFECSDCHRFGPYLACVRRAAGSGFKIPAGVARWARTLQASRELARSDTVIAVSEYVRDELVRSERLSPERVMTIPNLVDLPSVERAVEGIWPLDDISPEHRYLLFAGKLDLNKGAHLLPEALEGSGVSLPVVFAGDGPLRGRLEEEGASRGLDFRFRDWLDNDRVLLLMRKARALLFPSAWQEPLSRVLLEGCAAGSAIIAMSTGGTGDIIKHGESGWLAGNVEEFSRGIREVVENDRLNELLREGAKRQAREKFAAPVVAKEVEALYSRLLARGRRP